MISVDEAFQKFRKNINEPTKKEREDASRRQQQIREYLSAQFTIEHDFLSGSYKRWTKTKPLKDVDIFCVMDRSERKGRDDDPAKLLNDVADFLAGKYGSERVSPQRRSVCVEFGARAEEAQVLSFDVVPAFTHPKGYEIPDTATTCGWTKTDPRVHEELAKEKHQAYGQQWKGLVRMVKRWNALHDKPVRPSFLLEIMAIDLFDGEYGGNVRYELKQFFASAAARIDETWPDPAGLGPPVSDAMDSARVVKAQEALGIAEAAVTKAILLERHGKTGDALRVWRDEVFGDYFPLS